MARPEPFDYHSSDHPSDEVVQTATAAVGLSDPKHSQRSRQMLDLVNRLHSTGVQVDIDLPQIAVIGSQSAGKSSLIESISGITLPRAAGTCTRCPTECRLSKSKAPWQCTVSLRFTTDAQGQALGQARNQVFGETIYDKTEVEDRIRRAQKAILNPTKPAKFFLEEDDDDDEPELTFSSNCVSLQISGPDVGDLSFVDLPGLVATIGSNSKGGENDIALVESLVTTYIKKQNCIILLTVACETDFENQGAHRLTKQYDPQGQRTIGVLTKPDRIQSGDEMNWLSFIRNEREPLDNNWFCVKQPNSQELKAKMTWEQARKKEDEWFASTAPWCELDATHQRYLRTANLMERLSVILSDLISKRMPQIAEELGENIRNTRNAIADLPKPPSDNPMSEITALLHGFVVDVSRHVEGVPNVNGLLQKIRPAQQKFRKAVRATAPNFRPYEKRFDGKRHVGRAAFLVEEEGEAWEEEGSDSEAKEETVIFGVHSLEKIYVDEVYKRAQEAITRELPGHTPYQVQKEYIQEIISKWKAPAMSLCKSVYDTISDHIKKLVASHLSHFGQGYLQQRVRTIMQQHIEECRTNAEDRISWLLELESRPFSLNTHYFSDYKTKFLTHYKGQRQKYDQTGLVSVLEHYRTTDSSIVDLHPTGISKIMSGLAEVGLHGIDPYELQKLLPHDEMESALTIMADVRAYFQVAYKRFADNVPLAIDQELVCGVENKLLEVLHGQLGTNTPRGHEICQDLARESPQVADKRDDLRKKLQRLETAHRQLQTVGA